MKEGKNIHYPTSSERAEQDNIYRMAMRMIGSATPLRDVVLFLRSNYKAISIKHKSMHGET